MTQEQEQTLRNNGQRLITREQFNSNWIFSAVFTTFKYDFIDTVDKKPFNIILKFGDKFDEVKRLQDFLKIQSVFPNIESTGVYGNITAKAVYLFQIKNNVAPINELDTLKGRRVGQKTLNKINEIINK